MPSQKTKTIFHSVLIPSLLFFLMSSEQQASNDESSEEFVMEEEIPLTDDAKDYNALINNLNSEVNSNRKVSGRVELNIEGDNLTIDVNVKGLAPNMPHLQHLHGNEDGTETDCPSIASDNNEDGIVDIKEAVESAGITMIPLHDDPLNLEIKTDTYPVADDNGNIKYTQTISLSELRKAVREKYGVENFELHNFTYMIHGIVGNTSLPETVETVLNAPAQVTLPVGCGHIIASNANY